MYCTKQLTPWQEPFYEMSRERAGSLILHFFGHMVCCILHCRAEKAPITGMNLRGKIVLNASKNTWIGRRRGSLLVCAIDGVMAELLIRPCLD